MLTPRFKYPEFNALYSPKEIVQSKLIMKIMLFICGTHSIHFHQ